MIREEKDKKTGQVKRIVQVGRQAEILQFHTPSDEIIRNLLR